MLLFSIVSALIAAKALGVPTFSYNPSSSTFISIKLQTEIEGEQHSGVYLMISALLCMSTVFNVLAVKKPIPRILFVLAFSYCSAKSLLSWAFPLSMSIDSPHHGVFQLPWLFTITSTFVGTSAAINASLQNSSSSNTWIFILSAIIPIMAIVWMVVEDTLHEHLIGVIWISAIINSSIGISTRVSELSREVSGLRKGSSKDSSSITSSSSSSASVCLMAAVLGICWTSLGSISSPHLSNDIMIPLSCLLLLVTKRGILVQDTHPLAITTLAASLWWILSSLHAILVVGAFSDDAAIRNGNEFPTFSLFSDADISFWTSSSLWLPVINIVLVFVPIPAILLGFMRRKDESEDVLFVLSVLSALSIIGSQAMSIRLLGLVGMIYAAWRCYDVGQAHKISNRLI